MTRCFDIVMGLCHKGG